jgi:anthranilate phosphoribosyltransferase
VLVELRAALREGRDLTFGQAFALCEALLEGAFAMEQAAQVLVQLATKGETPGEVHGFVACLLQHAQPVPYDGLTVDTCGTGGSGLARFNVSTSVAFILAAGGLCVAKHGNRGSLRRNGSFDLLDALGVPVDLDGSGVAACLSQTGLGLIYAPRFHPVLSQVAPARRLAGRRTIFNLAGPLANPTRVRTQVVGAATKADALTIARCLHLLGRESGFSVTGSSGIDDVDLQGPALLYAADAAATSSELDPRRLGLSPVAYCDLPGGDADVNAELFLELLAGRAPAALRDVVCLSAGLVFFAAGQATSLNAGLEFAERLLDSGAVRRKFAQYREVASRVARADG